MPNELYLDKALAKNIKPVKCGDFITPIEIGDSNVRVNCPTEVQSLKVDGMDVGKWHREMFICGFYGNASKMWIPLNGYIYEKTIVSSQNEYIAFVAPYGGELDFVVVRSEAVCGSSVVGLHKSSIGTEAPNSTASESVTIDMSVDDTAYKFKFSSATFDAGDILAISFDPTNSSYDTNVTSVFKFNVKEEL